MATGQTIIDRALRLIGAIESGESPTAQESADALVALNAMIDSWDTERLSLYAWQDKTFTLVPGEATVTLGAAGNITTRPVKIENVFVREGSIDFPIELVDQGRFNSIPDKTTSTNLPRLAYYEPTYAQGVLNLWPVPNTANVLHVVMWVPIGAIASVGTTISLPPGYERALAYNLAIEIAPEYEVSVSQEVAKIAADSKANIQRANNRPIKCRPEFAVSGRTYEIEADV